MKRTSVTIMIVVLAVAVLCSTKTLAHKVHATPSVKPAKLNFFSTFTISKFDQDTSLDSADLSSFGSIKSINLSLSHSKRSTVIDFKTVSQESGSLFAQDIDNDGDTDLIWSDLVHAEDVTVWLGDGTGLFERDYNHSYAQRFVLNDLPIMSLPEVQEESSDAIVEDAPIQEATSDHQPFYYSIVKLSRNFYEQIRRNSCATETPSGRAPPSLLS